MAAPGQILQWPDEGREVVGGAEGQSAHLATSVSIGSILSHQAHLRSVLPFTPKTGTSLFPQCKQRVTLSIACPPSDPCFVCSHFSPQRRNGTFVPDGSQGAMQTAIEPGASAEHRAFTALPATTLTAGHSRKSSGTSGQPSGSSCTHNPLPASNPCTACSAQARGTASSSACGPHRAQRFGACRQPRHRTSR